MKILMSGSHGLVGRALLARLLTDGHKVIPLTRKGNNYHDVETLEWEPEKGGLDIQSLEGLDAVIHLAGENVASGRWTEEKKTLIRNSRVLGTQNLCEALSKLQNPPKVLLSASAIGFFGDRGDEVLDEDSKPGRGFLCDVVKEWESASSKLADKGVRVVQMRFGLILSPDGGALRRMLVPFKMGIGGPLGDGSQFMSWVSLTDAVNAIVYLLKNEHIQGPVNVVAPKAVTNANFSKILGKALGRPAFFKVPAFMLRFLFGEMGEELFLSSAKVNPKKLSKSDFVFKHQSLKEAFADIL